MTDPFFEALYPGLTGARQREEQFAKKMIAETKGVAFTTPNIRAHYEGGLRQYRKDFALIDAALKAEVTRIKSRQASA